MAVNPRKPFWERFDLHVKRWQTVCALIVAIGVIGGFVVTKLGWHWPGSAELTPVVGTNIGTDASTWVVPITTRVRYQSAKWTDRIEVKGVNPMFEVSIGYFNMADEAASDVVLHLALPEGLLVVPGTATLKNASYPERKQIDEKSMLSGINIGTYATKSNAYLQSFLAVDTNALPCGTTDLALRGFYETRAENDAPAMYSTDARVAYSKACM